MSRLSRLTSRLRLHRHDDGPEHPRIDDAPPYDPADSPPPGYLRPSEPHDNPPETPSPATELSADLSSAVHSTPPAPYDSPDEEENEGVSANEDPNGEGWNSTESEDDPEQIIFLDGKQRPTQCKICEWSGRSDQLLHRTYLLDKNRFAKYQDLQKKAIFCQSCCLIVKCLRQMGYDKPETTIHFLTSPLVPMGTFFSIVGDTSLPLQLYHRSDISNRSLGYKDLMKKMGVPTHAGLPRDTSSKKSARWARSCLDACYQTHKTCRGPRAGFLPTRLIDVGDATRSGNKISLVDAEDIKAPGVSYIALSHCWGRVSPECCTTRETYKDRTTEIPWDLLPKTFQDAVQVTRELNYQYLWVDSLCIIQQDGQDWQHESGKMLDVFANAAVTLAAVHSFNSNGGLFASNDESNDSLLCSLRWTSKVGVEEAKIGGVLDKDKFGTYSRPLHLRRSLPRFHTWKTQDLPAESPLFTRAWAYQERLVSPRVLYFTKQELLWECFEGSYCACTGDSHAISPKQNHRRAVINSDCHARWRDVVAEYSRLDLTLEKDKFPAISAVAVQIQQIRPKANYLAGLWSDSLVRDLLWRTLDSARGRPASQIAPSWSWASVKSGVEYSTYNIQPLVDAVTAECVYAGSKLPESPHMECVVSGAVALHGPLIKFKPLPKTPERSHRFLEHAESQTKLRFFEDSLAEMSLVEGNGAELVYGLAIAKSHPRDPKSFHGLVLRKNEERGTYTRIGALMAISIMPSGTELRITRLFEKFGATEKVVIE